MAAKRARKLTFLIPLICTAAHLHAQQSASKATPSGDLVIRRTVRRVIVDVVVTGKDGNAVHGLSKDDFSLTEDKKAQRLLSFDVHDGSKPDYVPPKVPPLPANTFVDVPNAPEQGPLYIILYDMVNMEVPEQASSRKPLLDFIDSKPPGTRFAIFVNSDGTKLLQGFTQDKTLLRAALTSHGPGPHLPDMFLYGANYGSGNTGASLSLMNHLADYLDGIPGRKNLLWISSRFPLSLYADQDSDIRDQVKATLAAMVQSQIAIYPIDARGVVVYDEASVSGSVGTPNANGSAPGGARSIAGGSGTAQAYMGENEIASLTGGHAYYSDNRIDEILAKAVDQGSSFYTLSYSPTNDSEDGTARSIEVKLSKPGYRLEYRRFYYAVTPDSKENSKGALAAYRAAAKQQDTLYGSIQHGAPMLHDLVFSSHVRMAGSPALATPQQMLQIQDEPAYFKTRRRNAAAKPMPPIKLQKYLIDYMVIDQQLKTIAAQTGRQPMLEFAAAAYNLQGRMLNGVVNNAAAAPPAKDGGKASALFRVEQEFELPLEAAWLRVAVRDTLTDRTGTLEIPLPLKAEPVSQAQAATH